jgi:hypothetical protein
VSYERGELATKTRYNMRMHLSRAINKWPCIPIVIIIVCIVEVLRPGSCVHLQSPEASFESISANKQSLVRVVVQRARIRGAWLEKKLLLKMTLPLRPG